MNNILVPVGTSPNAHETLQYAVDFATEFGSRVYAMEVFNVTAGAGKVVNISGARGTLQLLTVDVSFRNCGNQEVHLDPFP